MRRLHARECEGAGLGSRPLRSSGEPESGEASREPLGCGTPRFLKALRSFRFRHERPTPLGSIRDYNGGPCNKWLRPRNLVRRSRERGSAVMWIRAMKSPACAGLRQSGRRDLKGTSCPPEHSSGRAACAAKWCELWNVQGFTHWKRSNGRVAPSARSQTFGRLLGTGESVLTTGWPCPGAWCGTGARAKKSPSSAPRGVRPPRRRSVCR